jgi:hypothetical protein
MLIENYSFIRICMLKDLKKIRINTIKICPITCFKGMLTGARGSIVDWGTRRLEAERSRTRFPVRRPLDFFFHLMQFFQLHFGPGVYSLWYIWVPGICPGLKGCPAHEADSRNRVCEPIA